MRRDEEVFIHDNIKLAFEVRDLIHSFDVDPTKIDVFVKHVFVEVDEEGNSTVTEKRYNTRKCTASDYNDTDYEREFWKDI